MTQQSSQLFLHEIITNMDWPLNHLFSEDDKQLVKSSVPITDSKATDLVTHGRTIHEADETESGMWFKINSSISDSGTDVVENYFTSLYKKISCCLGRVAITVPMLKFDSTTNTMTKEYKTIQASKSECCGNKRCLINGIDWYDDNTTEGGHNPRCEELLIRLVAFLEKYNPESKMLNTYGGCIANRNMAIGDVDFTLNPILYDLVSNNRSCMIDSCSGLAYKRKQDRRYCANTICQANVNLADVAAGHDVSVIGTKISQQCGGDSTMMQTNNLSSTNSNSTANTQSNASKTAIKLKQMNDAKNKKNNIIYASIFAVIVLFFIVVAGMILLKNKNETKDLEEVKEPSLEEV